MFNFGNSGPPSPGLDLRITVNIGLEEMVEGLDKYFRFERTLACPDCGGKSKRKRKTCQTCYGDGMIDVPSEERLKLAPGCLPGFERKVAGRGSQQDPGGEIGDLIFVVAEKDHFPYVREDIDLKLVHYISIPDAVLGTKLILEHIGKKIRFPIAPGTPSGKVFRLKNQGIPDPNYDVRGDLFLQVKVWIPRQLSEADKVLLEKLSGSGSFAPRPSRADLKFVGAKAKKGD